MAAFAKIVVIVFRRRDLFPLFCVVIKNASPGISQGTDIPITDISRGNTPLYSANWSIKNAHHAVQTDGNHSIP